jgi:hypothetical protein
MKDIVYNKKVILNLELFKLVLNQEAKKLVGKTMKRFEISDNKEIIKREVKELIYESFRDIIDTISNGSLIFDFNNSKETQKSKEK